MKSFKIILSLVALLVVVLTASFTTTIDSGPTVQCIIESTMAVAPIGIVTASITPEIIQDLRLKYGTVKLITIEVEPAELDEKGKIIKEAECYQFIVRRPDRGLIKMLTGLAEKGDFDVFSESIIKNLVVAGDIESLDEGVVFIGVVGQLKGMISPANSFLSKV